jgi:hypothetical protein
MTKDVLVAEMDKAMSIIGYVNTWVQPIRARVMMQGTGIQTPVGIKVKGPELEAIEDVSGKSRHCSVRCRARSRLLLSGFQVDITSTYKTTSNAWLSMAFEWMKRWIRSGMRRRRQYHRHQAGGEYYGAVGGAVFA